MLSKKAAFLALLFLIPFLTLAQSANKNFHSTDEPNIFKNDQGAVIEYLGLQEWTAEQVQDSLKILAPNQPVHACMAVLEQNLGFPATQVMSYMDSRDDETPYTVVTIIEDESKIDYFELPKEEKPVIEEWAGDLNLGQIGNKNMLVNGLQWFKKGNEKLILSDKFKKYSSYFSEKQVEFLKQVQKQISNFNSAADRKLAGKTLKRDGNIVNRILASLILLNFDNTKKEMYMIIAQMHAKKDRLSSISSSILNIMTSKGQKVDWSGAVNSIRALLAGTNVENFQATLEILTKTNISPSLADDVLTNNFFLLKEYVTSNREGISETAMAFVNQISGKEFETTEEAINWLSKF